MSAFIVDDETMDRCVTAILLGAKSGATEFLSVPFLYNPGAPSAIGRLLFAMNEAAIDDRYGDLAREGIAGPTPPSCSYNYTRVSAHALGLVQLVKSCDCLLHQCIEGDLPESDVYRELLAVRGRITHSIVAKLPAYDAAVWE